METIFSKTIREGNQTILKINEDIITVIIPV